MVGAVTKWDCLQEVLVEFCYFFREMLFVDAQGGLSGSTIKIINNQSVLSVCRVTDIDSLRCFTPAF